MSAIDELLIAVGIEEGSTLEELYQMLREIQGAGGTIKLELSEDLPTKGQLTNIYRRITEMENRLMPMLSVFPESVDKLKEYMLDLYEGLREQFIKDEIREIDEIVRKILNKFPTYKRDVTVAFNKATEEMEDIKGKLDSLRDDLLEAETEDRRDEIIDTRFDELLSEIMSLEFDESKKEYFNDKFDELKLSLKEAREKELEFVLKILKMEKPSDKETVIKEKLLEKEILERIIEKQEIIKEESKEQKIETEKDEKIERTTIIREVLKEQLFPKEELQREAIKEEIINNLFKTEIPKDLPMVDPRPEKMISVLDTLIETITNILQGKTEMETGLEKWTSGHGTIVGRGSTREQRTEFGALFGIKWPGWQEGMPNVRKIMDEVIKPFIKEKKGELRPLDDVKEMIQQLIDKSEEVEEEENDAVRQALLDSIKNLDKTVDYNYKILRMLRSGFEVSQKFEKAISQQITLMDGRVKDIHDKVSRQSIEDETFKKDSNKKGEAK